MEILEWLRESAGCGYISDLRYGINNKFAKTAVKGIDLSKYTLHEIADAINYIYGNDSKFDTIADVKLFLGKKPKRKRKFLKTVFHQSR